MIREATAADAAACARIYAPYVTGSVVSFEAQPPSPGEMARRIGQAHLWLVAEEHGEVQGYAYGGPHQQRAAYRWAADVSVYLDPRHQGRGLGRALYTSLFGGLADLGVCVVCAGVALPNPASEALHRSMGFEVVGTYRRIAFKAGRWIDTRWYQRDLRPPGEPPPAEAPGRPR